MGNKKQGVWLWGLAMLIVVGSHIYMLVYGLPVEQMTPHAILNLVAVVLFGIEWYRRK